jgi:hypothetical protein
MNLSLSIRLSLTIIILPGNTSVVLKPLEPITQHGVPLIKYFPKVGENSLDRILDMELSSKSPRFVAIMLLVHIMRSFVSLRVKTLL